MSFASKTALVLGLAAVLPGAVAHIALWHPSMYGWDPNDYNQQLPVYPLYNLPFDQWWFHGYIDQPPADGVFMDLPSGGTFQGEVACNKALTSFGDNPPQQTGLYACDGTGPQGGIGAMHTADQWMSPDPQDVKGCGIAIAYKDDVSTINPEDFTVITVNYTCPWWKHVDFQIPSDLPPCPPGGCHCMWGWVHSIDAGSEQMYFNGFRCNVTGASGTMPLPQAQIANKCPVDKSNCTVGAKQPHYWLQQEGNNNLQGYYDPPFYNGDYGFMNGAQTDLFANVAIPSTTTTTSQSQPTSTTSTSTQSTSSTQTTSSSSTTPVQNTPTTTSSSSSITSPSSGSGANCKRAKRAFDRLEDPQALARHRKRSEILRQSRTLKRTVAPSAPVMEERDPAKIRKVSRT